MNQLATKTYKEMRKRLLKSVTIKCKECQGNMNRIFCAQRLDLGKETIIGYRCKDCSHHYLFDNNPI